MTTPMPEQELERQVTLMLCAPSVMGRMEVPPLGATGWNQLREILANRGMSLAALLERSIDDVAKAADLNGDQAHRIRRLLSRGGPLAIELERLQSRGIWTAVQGDPTYPQRLLTKLGTEAPPILFGVGDSNIAANDSIGVVGSREADAGALALAEAVARAAANGGLSVVSGGARGVDSAAMTAALESGGSVVGVLVDGLEKRVRDPQVRVWLAEDQLCLVTPFAPGSHFSVGAAMSRNKSIYGLADAVVVIAATAGKGGTWAGATEALKKGWGPVFVQPTSGDRTADRLVALGALRLPEPLQALSKDDLLVWSSVGEEAGAPATPGPDASTAQFTVFGEPEPLGAANAGRERAKRVRRRR